MTHPTERLSSATAAAARFAALLDAMAAVWQRVGAGRLVWRDGAGREIYASGAAHGNEVSLPLLDGTLGVEDCPAAFQPLLPAQVRLLQEAIQSQAESELLVDELMRTTDHLVALYEVSAAARIGRDLTSVMRACVEQSARLTGSRYGVLVIRETWRAEAAARVFTFPAELAFDADRAPGLLSAAEGCGETVITNTADECARLWGDAFDARRVVCAPILIGNRTDAALFAFDKPADFTSGDLKLVAALADAAAGFLERERSYEHELGQARVRRELEIAADIQSRLLPHEVPSLPGVQVAAAWQPSREVGGDFFDVQILSGDRQLALALGDVTGKGVPAALLMAMAHSLLRMGFAFTGSPAEAVRLLNSGLAGDLSNADRLLTLFAATYEPATGVLRAVNCGHSPVLVCQRGRVELWEPDGPPLGLLPDVMSVERERRLKRGDVLAVLSDGFSEARTVEGDRIGVDTLIDTLQRTADRDASAIADALQQLVDASTLDGARDDDRTLVVMKVLDER